MAWRRVNSHDSTLHKKQVASRMSYAILLVVSVSREKTLKVNILPLKRMTGSSVPTTTSLVIRPSKRREREKDLFEAPGVMNRGLFR